MPRADAIDISRHNGTGLDWPTIDVQVDTVAIKATQGSDFVDPTYAANRAGMNRPGIRRRFIYHWLSPDADRRGDAVAQARHYLRTVGPLDVGEGVLLDFEQSSTVNSAGQIIDTTGVTVDQAVIWCDTVEAATGRPVAVYLGRYAAHGTAYFNPRLFNGRRGRWLAAYVSEERARAATAPVGWDAWQWTSTGSIPGVADPTIDLSQIDRYELLDAACGLTTTPALEDDMLTIFTFAEAYAQLIGWTGDGRLKVWFPGPGTGAYLDGLVASGVAVRRTVPIATTHSMSLVGAIPTGDTKRTWSAADFHEVLPANPSAATGPTKLAAELGAGGQITGVLS